MYKTADVIIFCFSLAQLKLPKKRGSAGSDDHAGGAEFQTSTHISLKNIRNYWLPEAMEIIRPRKEETAGEAPAEKEDAEPAAGAAA